MRRSFNGTSSGLLTNEEEMELSMKTSKELSLVGQCDGLKLCLDLEFRRREV